MSKGKRLRITFEVEVDEEGYKEYQESYYAENMGEALINEAVGAWEGTGFISFASADRLYSNYEEAKWEEITIPHSNY